MRVQFPKIIARIESVRADAGLNKAQFCARLGMKPQTYNNYIGGQGSKPSVKLIAGVAEAFSVDANWLLFGGALAKIHTHKETGS